MTVKRMQLAPGVVVERTRAGAFVLHVYAAELAHAPALDRRTDLAIPIDALALQAFVAMTLDPRSTVASVRDRAGDIAKQATVADVASGIRLIVDMVKR